MLYKKAPITEAVIELRWLQKMSLDAIDAAARRLRPYYPISEAQNATEIVFDAATGIAKTKIERIGSKLSSTDVADTLILQGSGLICSRLAPYVGWDEYRARAHRDWTEIKRVVGSKEVSRIGIRYINRLDIPAVGEAAAVDVRDYLTLWPHSPTLPNSQPMTGYTLQITRPLGADECSVNLTSSSVPSPLLNHVSFLLDLDVYREQQIPKKEDAMWEIVEKMRTHKNIIFEACVTDKARALFQ